MKANTGRRREGFGWTPAFRHSGRGGRGGGGGAVWPQNENVRLNRFASSSTSEGGSRSARRKRKPARNTTTTTTLTDTQQKAKLARGQQVFLKGSF